MAVPLHPTHPASRFPFQALNKKEASGKDADSPDDSNETYVLTPRTQQRYEQINKEFANAMHMGPNRAGSVLDRVSKSHRLPETRDCVLPGPAITELLSVTQPLSVYASLSSGPISVYLSGLAPVCGAAGNKHCAMFPSWSSLHQEYVLLSKNRLSVTTSLMEGNCGGMADCICAIVSLTAVV